jgi:hypothetical protein
MWQIVAGGRKRFGMPAVFPFRISIGGFMNRVSIKMLTAASMVFAAMTSSAWAATPEDCQRAIDDVSITGRANYDSATEAQMTKYLSAANTALMQKGGSAQATAELKNYQQQLDAATKAQKIKVGDSDVLKEKLNKAMQCVSSLK